MNDRERAIRQRLKDEFPHYAGRCLQIRTKAGEIEPMVLNHAQQYLHDQLEQQLRETGKIRALILKGRQQGCSTYTEGRFYWKVTHRRGVRAFILTHLDDATRAVFEMAKRFHEHCPDLVKPSTRASNAKELVFDRLDSGYCIGTAGSVGVGRSLTLQFFHGSEVAYWPHADTHIAGALQAVPDAPGTEVILESTSSGPQGTFYDMCQAAQRGEGEYRLIFIPWFWQLEYRRALPEGITFSDDERSYAAQNGLDDAQLCWRRGKIVELHGVMNFQREYPANIAEAFTADAVGALWSSTVINALRVTRAPDLTRVVIAIDPSVSSKAGSDETGIVVAGIGVDGHAYVLDDRSGVMSPHGWAETAIKAYYSWGADRIIGEVNNGGDLVEINLRTVDENIPYSAVHASRGKRIRAEPIAALYEQGRVHHVGPHVSLERELTTWEPFTATYSPGRLDAMVWALTELMIGIPFFDIGEAW